MRLRARPSVGLTLLGVVAAPLSLLAASPAVASNSWAVPSQAWVTVKGHGYGHGHGMSQYGAEGAARQGLSAAQIVTFYYPGTTMGHATGPVRVHLTADTDSSTMVVPRTGLTVTDLRTKRTRTLPDKGATRWRLAATGAGVSVVDYRSGGTWHRWRSLKGDGSFGAHGKPITLVTPSGSVAYRGTLESRRTTQGSRKRVTVNQLSLEAYLKGVVPQEMPATWSPAAVRAQAIAARTYAAFERREPLSNVYQICDTTLCQVYGGYSAEHPASNAAVDATSGQVRLYQGNPAFTQFSSSNGGWASAGSQPYLKAFADPYDGWSGNPNHSWSQRIDATKIEKAWPSLGNLTRIRVDSRDGHGDWGGRVLTMTLVGSRNSVHLSGDDFRFGLGLRSTYLTFAVTAK